MSFGGSFLVIFWKVFPVLIAPFALALFTQRFFPKVSDIINRHKGMSFYIWALALTVVLSQSISLLMSQFNEHRVMFLWMVLISAFLCFLQFHVGHIIGKRYGDRIAGGQALGQKNTVLAIWMAQSYLNPLSSIVPTIYILWHNLYNSYQMMQKDRRQARIINLNESTSHKSDSSPKHNVSGL